MRWGTRRQRAAYRALVASNVMRDLAAYHALLVGTIPLDVDLPGSDLDLVCRAHDLEAFITLARAQWGKLKSFAVGRGVFQGLTTALVRFHARGFPFEIFAQDRPVLQQWAVLHFIAERRLLDAAGPLARHRVRTLKARGLKTEPAFAAAFGLAGDPYRQLLEVGRLRPGHVARLACKGRLKSG